MVSVWGIQPRQMVLTAAVIHDSAGSRDCSASNKPAASWRLTAVSRSTAALPVYAWAERRPRGSWRAGTEARGRGRACGAGPCGQGGRRDGIVLPAGSQHNSSADPSKPPPAPPPPATGPPRIPARRPAAVVSAIHSMCAACPCTRGPCGHASRHRSRCTAVCARCLVLMRRCLVQQRCTECIVYVNAHTDG